MSSGYFYFFVSPDCRVFIFFDIVAAYLFLLFFSLQGTVRVLLKREDF